jgi:hypothetical protein
MRITHLLAALLLASSFATQATAHTRTHKHHHPLHVRNLYMSVPMARSAFVSSYDSSANGPNGVSAGGTMWNGRSASEYGGGAP